PGGLWGGEGNLPATGKVGAGVAAEDASGYARQCALNALAAIKSVVGDLSAVARVVKVVGFVASAPWFPEQPTVINGAGGLLVDGLGGGGRHARGGVGVIALPLDTPVELEVIVEIAPPDTAP